MLTCNYQFKLKPNKRQIQEIENYLIACRKVWNYALTERKDWSNSRKSDSNKCSIEKEYIIRSDVYFAKVDKNYTSQTCPNCGTHTGKKELNERIHTCPECGFSCNRDFAASLVIKNRGLNAVGQPVFENASGEVLAGFNIS